MSKLAYIESIVDFSFGFTISSIFYGQTDDAALSSVMMLCMVLSGYGIVRTLDCLFGFNDRK